MHFASFGPVSLMPQAAVRVRGKGSRRGRAKGVGDKPTHGQYKRWTETNVPNLQFTVIRAKSMRPPAVPGGTLKELTINSSQLPGEQ